jgi:hypothetical protein
MNWCGIIKNIIPWTIRHNTPLIVYRTVWVAHINPRKPPIESHRPAPFGSP